MRTSVLPPTLASSRTSKSSPRGCAKPRWSARPWLVAQRKAHRVLADGDEVAVGQLLFDHRLAIDQRAVGAAQVADPERARAHFDAAMPARGGRVADHDVVVRSATDGHHFIGEGDDPSGEGTA